jgi:choline dehydrogenase-like flavoprotein
MSPYAMRYDYDVLVVGSGFGGSVSALRLTEKGYRVGVLEAGRRFTDDQLPRTSWRLRGYLFAPALRCFGILRLTLLDNVLIMSGAGVGGGSLGYATPSTSHPIVSSPIRAGRWSLIGRPNWPPPTTRPSACSASRRTRSRPRPTVFCTRSRQTGSREDLPAYAGGGPLRAGT